MFKWTTLALVVVLGACTGSVTNMCLQLDQINPDAGFSERWTTNEKRQVLKINKKIDQFCSEDHTKR